MNFDTPATAVAAPPRLSLLRLRPEKKLLAALIFSLGVSALSQPGPLLAACACAAVFAFFSSLPPSLLLKRLASVNGFFLLLWLLLPFSLTARGAEEAAFTLGPFLGYPSGLALALLITLKGNAIALALFSLAGSSSLTENGHALLALRVPEKLVALLLITHANLALMAREYQNLFAAAKLRGFKPRTTLASYATYAQLIGLLLIRSWQHAGRIEQAMRLRGFCGRFPLIPSRCTCPPEVQEHNRRAGQGLLFFCVFASLVLIVWNYTL